MRKSHLFILTILGMVLLTLLYWKPNGAFYQENFYKPIAMGDYEYVDDADRYVLRLYTAEQFELLLNDELIDDDVRRTELTFQKGSPKQLLFVQVVAAISLLLRLLLPRAAFNTKDYTKEQAETSPFFKKMYSFWNMLLSLIVLGAFLYTMLVRFL